MIKIKKPIKNQKSKFELYEVIRHRKIDSMRVNTSESKITVRLAEKSFFIICILFVFVVLLFLVQIVNIQISGHKVYKQQAFNNVSNREILFAKRGLILDRNNELLAYNEQKDGVEYDIRKFSDESLHLLGNVRYPKKDKNGNYYVFNIEGLYGVEKRFDSLLQGNNGFFVKQISADNSDNLINFVEKPNEGKNVQLTIDLELQKIIYDTIKTDTDRLGFESASAVIMDINTGEIISAVDYVKKKKDEGPDYSGVYASISGLITPGSVVKPFIALAALEEDIISPEERIHSPGQLVLENKYDPDNPSYFLDNKAHGYVNITEALAASSNVYFYQIGGGYKNRVGLGIDKIFRYATLFGFGIPTKTDISSEPQGVVPNPEWKKKNFNDFWRVGDTYNTSIGQYNFLTTPMQLVRATAVLANGGFLVEPKFNKYEKTEKVKLVLSDKNLETIKKGMRDAVVSGIGSAKRLNIYGLKIAAKTGTAQIGNKNEFINSTLIGFYPYDNPKYSFAVVFEKAPFNSKTRVIATVSAGKFFSSILNQAKEKLR